jgi:uncharacterized protein (DUF1015 family)
LADARPFRAVRYVPERAGPLEDLVAPPYDVISPEDQKDYYARSPFNVIRLIFGQIHPTDAAGDNRYTRAAAFFDQWTRQGILRQDPALAYYLYRHHFRLPGEAPAARGGLVAAIRLEALGRGILPHERTLPQPKRDRLALTQAVQANLSPILALYDDPAHVIADLVRQASARPPDATVIKGEERHEVWVVPDAQWGRRVETALADQPLFIADGHHRYETAVAYQAQQRAAHPAAAPDAAFNFVMMLLTDARDPGLRILPTHRVLHGLAGYDPARFRQALARVFRLTAVEPEALVQGLRAGADGARFGVCFGAGDFALLTVPAEASAADMPTAAGLDVEVLHRRILAEHLGLRQKDEEGERVVTYTRDAGWAIGEVAAGRAQLAFLLRPPAVETVLAVARAGGLMPQKSTYFFPKPLSGLFFRTLQPDGALPRHRNT